MATAFADPATAATYARARARSKVVLRATVVVTAGLWVVTWLMTLGGADEATQALIVPNVVAGIALFVVVATQFVRAQDVRRVRDALERPWQRVEVVMLRGAPADAGKWIVMVLDPVTGQPSGTWLVAMIHKPRWLSDDARLWAYLAVADGGSSAVLAPLDRSRFVILRSGGEATIHEWAWEAAGERWSFDAPAELGAAVASEAGHLGVWVEPDHRRRWPNAPLTRRSQLLVMAALVSLAIIVSVASLAAQRASEASSRQLLADGVRATATVVTSDPSKRGSAQIELSFVTSGHWIYRVRRSVAADQRPAVGATVQVAYDPHDPSELVLVGRDEPRNDQLAFIAWAAVVVVGARFAWGALRRKSASTNRSDIPSPRETN